MKQKENMIEIDDIDEIETMPTNEEFAEMFANRPEREPEHVQVERAQKEADRKQELVEREAARKARIRGRKRATFVSGMVIAALVFTLYIFGAKALEITGLTGTLEAIAHLGIATILMWLGVFAHRYIKHEIYSNL